MENLLIKYFEARIKNENRKTTPGPVITISREYGCPSKILAGILADKLNSTGHSGSEHSPGWRWISRELLEESAKELKVDPKHINYVFDYHERTLIDDMLASTRKDGSYKSDHAIKKTIGKVVRTLGEKGHIIIVGRAGVAINRDIPDSLHIRLMAPVEWRIETLVKTHAISRDEAVALMNTKDANRKLFLEYYLGSKFRLQIFDVVYNCGYLTMEEIADSIVKLAVARKML
jgi:cytidylate kinase